MGKDDLKGKDFFWLVRNSKGEDLVASEHVTLMGEEDQRLLQVLHETKVTALQPVRSEEGRFGVIIYVKDGKSPAITGTVRYG